MAITTPPEPKTPKNRTQYNKLLKTAKHLHKKQDYINAIKYLNKSLDYDSSKPNILVLLAECLFQTGNKQAAMQMMSHALLKSPNDPIIANVLGNAALEMDFFDLAQKFHQKYIELKPDDPAGYNNYATALREDGKYEEAINLLKDVLPIFPKAEELWNTLGSVVSFRDGPKEAIVFYEECLKINPQNSQVLNNIAPAYYSIGEIEKSEEAIRKSIKLSPKTKYQHMFLSSLLLQDKRLKEGWEEYKWSHYSNNFNLTVKNNNIPYWKGESLKDKKIFVFGEQGIGDEVLFTWLYKNLIKDAKKVGISCQARLVSLFRNSFPEAQVDQYYFKINRKLDIEYMYFPDFDLSEYDYQITAGEVASHYWKEYQDINDLSHPILVPETEKITYWKKRIKELPNKISVGIAWRSGLMLAKRSRNYATLLEWAPLLKNKNINFINIQYGDCEDELKELEEKTGIVIHNFKDLDLKDDFMATTAMMCSLDLVMGPSSSPIHQASFAGTEAWYFVAGKPWWAFNEKIPAWNQNCKIISKNDNDLWSEFMEEKAKDFKNWVNKKK